MAKYSTPKLGAKIVSSVETRWPTKAEAHRRAVADAIDDQAEQDDRNGEGIEADAADDALLLFGEVELGSPVVEHGPADGEAERRGHQRHETARETTAATGFDPPYSPRRVDCRRSGEPSRTRLPNLCRSARGTYERPRCEEQPPRKITVIRVLSFNPDRPWLN